MPATRIEKQTRLMEPGGEVDEVVCYLGASDTTKAMALLQDCVDNVRAAPQPSSLAPSRGSPLRPGYQRIIGRAPTRL